MCKPCDTEALHVSQQASRLRLATGASRQQVQTSGADVDTRARWIASQIRTHRGRRRNLRIFDGDTGDNGDTAPTLSFSAFTAWGHVGTNGDKSIKRF